VSRQHQYERITWDVMENINFLKLGDLDGIYMVCRLIWEVWLERFAWLGRFSWLGRFTQFTWPRPDGRGA